ncbi:MFS transporter [Actinoplanes utahensis]|uniref:MFS transporter n=2 Tax=Actinoplanes utahensis TaxID=1869 RepID=UPI001950160C|nr:MFS transporter [Actinoplanes utahensis]GIF31363.1 MFS transporter [Actinoplanes utahensis]
MTTVQPRPPATVPTAPNAPTRLIVAMALAQLGAYLTILTPVVVTMSIRVAQIAPDDKAAALGTVLSVGAVLALIGNPFFGAMSDRTTSRFGRRRPWLLGGMLAGFAGLLVVALGGSVPVLTAGWALAQLGVNATLSTLTALLPDQIPARQRGRVSGILGLMTSVAILLGSAMAAALAGNALLMFAVPSAIGVATVALLVTILKDRPAEKGHFAPYRFKEFLSTFYVSPRRHPDFVWNIISRFLIWMGLASVTTYQAYLLIDRFGYTTDNVANGILVATLISTVGLVVGSSAGGLLSDRTGRRKPFVLGSGIVVAVALAVIAYAGTFPVFLAAVLLFGLGQGVYLAVDLALATDVLPDPDDAAKDMGVLNIANALPQSLVPILAAPILAIGGGDANYSALFLAGAVVAVAGSLLVRMVRGAR